MNQTGMEQEPGELLEDGEAAPELTPQQIATYSSDFRNQMGVYLVRWRQCTDALTGFNLTTSAPSAWTQATSGLRDWLRPRQINFQLAQPIYRNVCARLQTELPAIGVVPASEDPEAIAKAQASEQAMRYHWRDADVKRILTDAVQWLVVQGTTGIHTFMAGDNVRQAAVPANALRAEPGVHSPDESRFLGVVTLTTKAALAKQYPDKADAINAAPEPIVSLWDPSQSIFVQRVAPDRVEVLQAYCRDGNWFHIVGDGTVLAQGKTPGNCIPLRIIRYTKIPGQFFGQGVLEPMLDILYAYTTIMNQMIDNARLMSNPKVLIERNSKVPEDAFTSRVGEKILYSGTKPDVWVPPPLPSYFQQLPAVLQALLHDVSGIHSTSMGKRAVGISSGRAIEALSVNDLAQLAVTQDEIEAAVVDMAKATLLYMKAFYPEQKMMRQFDSAGKAMFIELHATDLVEDPDVFLEAGTLFSSEVKDRDQRTMDLVRMGMMTPEEGKKALSVHLDPMAPIKLISDIQHAQKVLGAIIADPAARAQVYPTDNLKVFEEVVASFMQSDDYRNLDPDAEQRVAALYQQIVNLISPPQQPPPDIKQLPGVPKGKEPEGRADLMGGPVAGDADLTRPADAAVDAAEARDQFTQ